MKILIISPTNFYTTRGCHIRIYDQAVMLQRYGNTVKIVTYHLGRNPENLDVERLPNIPWCQKHFIGPSIHRVYLDFFLLIKSFFVARAYKPDIIHCHLHEGALIGYILKRTMGTPYVFDSQGSLVDEMIKAKVIKQNSWLYWLFYRIEKFLYTHSPHILTSNNYNRRVVTKDFGISESKTSVIPDMVKFDDIAVNQAFVAQLRGQYHLDRYKFVILYLGWLSNIEGIDDLIKITARLKKIRTDFIVLIAGHPNIRHYQKQIDALQVQREVMLIRGVAYDLIYNYYAASNFAITLKIPTTESNLKLLNYASAGLPIVCYDQDSNRSLIGDFAYYLNYDTSLEEKAAALSAYLDLPQEELLRRTDDAKAYVKKNFSGTTITEKLIRIYESRNAQ